jgi:hypothetical protein
MSCCQETKNKPFTEHSLVKAGKSLVRHFVDPSYDAFSGEDEKTKRLKACNSCEKLTDFMGKKQCSLCACFVEPKASLIDQECPHPENKWK